MRVRVCLCACVRVYLRACVYVCARVRARVRARVCIIHNTSCHPLPFYHQVGVNLIYIYISFNNAHTAKLIELWKKIHVTNFWHFTIH